MANTSTSFTGTGSQTIYTISYPYLNMTDNVVTVAGATKVMGVDYNIVGQTLTFTTAPTNGAAIKFQRTTSRAKPRVTYTNGASAFQDDLNRAVLQLLYSLQEIEEGVVQASGISISDASLALTKLQNISQWQILTRQTAGTGAPEAVNMADFVTYLETLLTTPVTAYSSLTGKPTLAALAALGVGTGLTSDGTNLNINSTFLASLFASYCGFATANIGAGNNWWGSSGNTMYGSTAIVDTNSGLTSGQGRYTIKVAGTYYFSAVWSNNGSNWTSLSIRKNGSALVSSSSASGSMITSVSCAVNDVVDFYASGGSTGGGTSGFSGYRVGV